MNILSFGGGVQTVALASMACLSEVEMPDVAIFADPQWESKATYDYMEWFEEWMLNRGLKLIRTTVGSLKEDSLSSKKRFASLPAYTEPHGMLLRQCTNEYKVQPVIQAIRRFIGLKRKERSKTHVKLWLGISLDEATRMKPSRVPWIENTYPLIDHRMTRGDCIMYLKKHNIPIPPKSACLGCPYHSDFYWSNMKKNSPQEWEETCRFDEAIRKHKVSIKNKVFLHRSMKPLRDVYLMEDQMDFFQNECEGHCGL